MTSDEFMQYMSVDKKVRDGKLYLVLLNKIGEATLSANYRASFLESTLKIFCNS